MKDSRSRLSDAEITAARDWARRRLGYLPPGWDDDVYVTRADSTMVRWFSATTEGQRCRETLGADQGAGAC